MANREEMLTVGGTILRSYLDRPDTIELMCNSNGTAFLVTYGMGKEEVIHPGFEHLELFLCLAADAVGTEWNARSPRLSAGLYDVGWRIEAGGPPVADAPYMALRVHTAKIFPLEDYEAKGILTSAQVALLREAMGEHKRIIIAGGVGSAKTSLLNALLDSIKDTSTRVLVLEDDPEIICQARDCERTWVNKRSETLRQLVQSSLRLNPSLVIVGEVRKDDALEMLKVFQTGHSGLATVHCSDAENALLRLEQLVQEGSHDPQRQLIGEVIDRIVHMRKVPERNSWECTAILAVDGWDGEQYRTTRLA